ncbi:MAG: hypothetical protein M1824_002987 [Vezdaea acicularis]|nr:MAG: hypothetical protein M1824_002987 [Vezdaea acicularis]
MGSVNYGLVQRGLNSIIREITEALVDSNIERRDEAPERPACGSGGAKRSYNTPLHVIALFLILFLSTLACSFPIIVRHFPKLPVPHHILFLSRHFGTGVLIATAFVHLLPTAFVSLTDPCLPIFWNKGYPAMAGLIAMTSVLIVVSIEMFFATRGAGHVHGGEYGSVPLEESEQHMSNMENGHARPTHKREESMRPFRQARLGLSPEEDSQAMTGYHDDESREHLMSSLSPAAPLNSSFPTHNEGKSPNRNTSNEDLSLDELAPQTPHTLSPDVPPSASQQKELLQCLLLEAGILFHSVFIGMALSVSTGPPFVVLLIAISFHQTFEGLALGSRIASISSFGPSSPKPWLMALAYGTTTPIGQAIGLAVHNLYDPVSQGGLLMVGVMNAISSGLLLFAGLVELLAEDFLSDKSYLVLKGRRRIHACYSVAAGAALMALVGAWA